MSDILSFVKPGVIFGKDIKTLFDLAKKNNFAIPAINCINTDYVNAALESASIHKSPIIIQFSYGGSSFFSGEGIKNSSNPHKKSIIGAISGAKYVHHVARHYEIPVILHTDHCNKSMLPWIDQLLLESERFFKKKGHPLFSSHMIDLSTENLKYNINVCKKYLKFMSNIDILLEIELGCTGGEEDGIDNTEMKKDLLYTRPEDVLYAYKNLKSISSLFTIAASFGNVHGVYKKGNVRLKPSILKNSQKIVKKYCKTIDKPINFVFHGGSGSSKNDISESISYGVVKINLDTDIQWEFWKGILQYYIDKKDFLHSQLGNNLGINYPNKKYYDPRSWIRASQLNVCMKLKKIFKEFNSQNTL